MTQTKLPEELPRYTIDGDLPESQKETKILSEEQELVLNKLLKAGGHVLDEEERDLLNRLMEKLHQETERVRSLRKVVIKDKPLDSFLGKQRKKTNNIMMSKTVSRDHEDMEEYDDAEGSDTPKSPSVKHIIGFSPEEVVRRYIECWNQQKFGAEYDCFSSDFMQIDRGAYVQARQTSYLQMLSRGGMRIDFGEISSSQMAGGEAEVVATKITQEPNRKPKEDKDLYRLKIEKGHWTIFKVENLD